MERLYTKDMTRDQPYISSLFTPVGNAYITRAPVKVLVPERFLARDLIFIENGTVKVIAYYACVHNGKYSIQRDPIYQVLTPTKISECLVDDTHRNIMLEWEEGTTYMPERTMIQTEEFMYDVLDEFFIKGNIPWFLNYIDRGSVFDGAKEYAGSNIGENMVIVKLLAAEISKKIGDRSIPFRYSINSLRDAELRPDTTGLNDLVEAFKSTLAKLAGGYSGSDGIRNAINNPYFGNTPIGNVLTDRI